MAETKRSVVTEFGVFSVGAGIIVLLAIALWVSMSGRSGMYRGVSRGLILGVPLGITAGLSIVSGVLVLATRSAWSVVLAVVSAFLLASAYLVPLALLGGLRVNLMTLAIVAVPILAFARCPKAMAEARLRRSGS